MKKIVFLTILMLIFTAQINNCSDDNSPESTIEIVKLEHKIKYPSFIYVYFEVYDYGEKIDDEDLLTFKVIHDGTEVNTDSYRIIKSLNGSFLLTFCSNARGNTNHKLNIEVTYNGDSGKIKKDIEYSASKLSDNSTWGSTTILPEGRAFHSTIVYKDYMYIIGGSVDIDKNVYYAKINSDGSLDDWKITSNVPDLPKNNSTVLYKDKIYLISGLLYEKIYYNTFNADGTLNEWKLNEFKIPITLMNNSSVAYNDRLYIIGGFPQYYEKHVIFANIESDGTVGRTKPEDAGDDPKMGTWYITEKLPKGKVYHKSIIHGKYIYVVGGYGVSSIFTYYAEVLSDGGVSEWKEATELPASRYHHSLEIHNNILYLFGGKSNIIYTVSINADGSLGKWVESKTKLPETLSSHDTAIYNDFIYIIGGWVDSAYYSKLKGDGTFSSISCKP